MLDEMNKEHFLNREHSGEYAEVAFDTYVNNKGKDDVIDIVTNIHYYEAGEGEPLIMVHGVGQNAYTWRNNFYELAKDFHVYAIDLPGHGFSGKPEISYTVEEFALTLEAFMNVNKIVSASFCAFGEAAVYVLDFAIHNLDRTEKLVFISPVISETGGILKGRGLNCVFGSMAGKMKNPQVVRSVLEDCYFDRTLVGDEVVREYWEGMNDKDFRIIARMCVTNFIDDNVISSLHVLKAPVLVILGTDDKITGGKNSNFMHLGFGRSNAIEVRNCGYLVHEEKHERTNGAIKTFLKG